MTPRGSPDGASVNDGTPCLPGAACALADATVPSPIAEATNNPVAKRTPKRVPTPDAGPYNQAGLMQVASGKGIYLCMGIPFGATQTVAVLPLSDPDATLDICVAWRKGEASPVVCKFLESVWHVFPQSRPGGAKAVAKRAS